MPLAHPISGVNLGSLEQLMEESAAFVVLYLPSTVRMVIGVSCCPSTNRQRLSVARWFEPKRCNCVSVQLWRRCGAAAPCEEYSGKGCVYPHDRHRGSPGESSMEVAYGGVDQPPRHHRRRSQGDYSNRKFSDVGGAC